MSMARNRRARPRPPVTEAPQVLQNPLGEDASPAVDPLDENMLPENGPAELIATNTAVRLACTVAAMLGPLALFFCWQEKESRAIRLFSAQSAALTLLHLAVGLGLLVLSAMLSVVPYLGFLVRLLSWIVYIALLLAMCVARVRLMENAWRGRRFCLPGMAGVLKRFHV